VKKGKRILEQQMTFFAKNSNMNIGSNYRKGRALIYE
jgi:hypothetical protein